jgi:hypothetical protein
MKCKFLKELAIINNEEYEFEYKNGSNSLTKLIDEWINLEMHG